MDIFALAEQNQAAARELLTRLGIIPLWESIGGEVHIVGSLRSGLMGRNRDIDLHVYTDRLDAAESFSVIARIAADRAIKEVQYINLADTDEECIEWHLQYEGTEGERWKFDIIHIRRGSCYDGFVEGVTEAIIRKLTPVTRQAILRIKYDAPDGAAIPGIEIYRAVLSGGVRSYAEFAVWREANPFTDSMKWRP